MIQLLAAVLGPADDLAALLACQLQCLTLGHDGAGIQLRLTQYLLRLLLGPGHIFAAGGDQLLGLFQLQRQLGPDLIQQIQRLVPDDDTFVRAEGHAFCLVDHAVEHIQQALYIFLFHSAVRSFLFVGAGRLNPAAASIPRRPAPVHTFPMAGGSGSSPAPWWS